MWQFHTAELQTLNAGLPIDETTPSIDEVKVAVAKMRGGKAVDICNIIEELLKVMG